MTDYLNAANTLKAFLKEHGKLLHDIDRSGIEDTISDLTGKHERDVESFNPTESEYSVIARQNRQTLREVI